MYGLSMNDSDARFLVIGAGGCNFYRTREEAEQWAQHEIDHWPSIVENTRGALSIPIIAIESVSFYEGEETGE